MLRALEYARFSSINQRDESIDAQFRAINDYAKRNNIIIVGSYKDEAVSGKTDLRDDFQRMMNAVLKKEIVIDVILVHKFNRFARNKYDSAVNKKKLKDIGVKVISVSQSIDDTPEGAMMESVIEAMDEYYSANLTVEVQKGLRENALKGQHTGGLVPFGFSLDENKRYVPNENAAVVKRIFEEYAAGKQTKQIIEDITADGVRNQRGKPFAERTVYDILKNEKYIGNYLYTLKGFQPIRLDGIIEPIIHRDLWEKAQERNNKQKSRIGKSKRVYFLTGKAVCGCCGANISGAGSKQPTKSAERVYYYQCAGKFKLKNGCDNTSIRKDRFEKEVLQTVIYTVMNDDAVREIVKIAYRRYLELQEKPSVSTEKLQAELYDTLSELKQLTKLYLKGKIDDKILDAENDELNRRKIEIETELNQREKMAVADISEEYLFTFLSDFIRDVMNEKPRDDSEFMRIMIETFVDKVIVYRQDITVVIKANFTHNNKVANVRDGGAIRVLAPVEITANIHRE